MNQEYFLNRWKLWFQSSQTIGYSVPYFPTMLAPIPHLRYVQFIMVNSYYISLPVLRRYGTGDYYSFWSICLLSIDWLIMLMIMIIEYNENNDKCLIPIAIRCGAYEIGQWVLSSAIAAGPTVFAQLPWCQTGRPSYPPAPSLIHSLNTYDLFQFRYGHVVVVVVATTGSWRIVWCTRRWMGWGHCWRGGAWCGAIAVTFGLVTRRCRWRHWAGQCWAILWIAIGRQTWGETQRFCPLCQAAHHRVFVCVRVDWN